MTDIDICVLNFSIPFFQLWCELCLQASTKSETPLTLQHQFSHIIIQREKMQFTLPTGYKNWNKF